MHDKIFVNCLVLLLASLCGFATIRLQASNHEPADKPRLIEQYEDIRFNDEKARLDNFAIQVQNEPGSNAYIIGYGGTDRPRNCEGLARANRAKIWLINVRGIDANRVSVIDGGFRSARSTELWLVRKGEEKPQISETVDKKTIRFLKPSLCGPAGRSFARAILTAP